jgi:protoporphyrin/coproporphyrin ferrochelatase
MFRRSRVSSSNLSALEMARIAIVLMNLGGPDAPDAVEPFLYNLFSDPAIIRLPGLLRLPLARVVAWRRARVARDIYERLGGSSPLLANTEAQARALEAALDPEYRCFIAMRYWRPASLEAAAEVVAWSPDKIVCLPLYPQFSTTTTASSLAAWQRAAACCGIDRPTQTVCCYPAEEGFIKALAGLIRPVLDRAAGQEQLPRLLLTAHGLPKKIVRQGDPYPHQVEATAAAVIRAIDRPELDWQLCYQSRVGPLEWIGPATDDAIRQAGAEGTPVVVAPISFVSEHSETLVELDLDYRQLAEASGVPAYHRVPTVGINPSFIRALAGLVRRAAAGDRVGECVSGLRSCASAGEWV